MPRRRTGSMPEGHRQQCDQMVRLVFNICPFATRKFSPIMSQVCSAFLPMYEINLPNFAKDIYFLPKWRNFAKSGHTDRQWGKLTLKRMRSGKRKRNRIIMDERRLSKMQTRAAASQWIDRERKTIGERCQRERKSEREWLTNNSQNRSRNYKEIFE